MEFYCCCNKFSFIKFKQTRILVGWNKTGWNLIYILLNSGNSASSGRADEVSWQCNSTKPVSAHQKIFLDWLPGWGIRVKLFNRVQLWSCTAAGTTQSKGSFNSLHGDCNDMKQISRGVHGLSRFNLACIEIQNFCAAQPPSEITPSNHHFSTDLAASWPISPQWQQSWPFVPFLPPIVARWILYVDLILKDIVA